MARQPPVACGESCGVEMLAKWREPEGVEVFRDSEGHGSGEQPQSAAAKNLSALLGAGRVKRSSGSFGHGSLSETPLEVGTGSRDPLWSCTESKSRRVMRVAPRGSLCVVVPDGMLCLGLLHEHKLVLLETEDIDSVRTCRFQTRTEEVRVD